MQHRQHTVGLLDDRNHRRRHGPAAVADLVEHALDGPAEFTERACANQTAAALQRVEHATDRMQGLDLVRRIAPDRQTGAQVLDFFLELFKEHFADLVVHVVVGLEANHQTVHATDGGRRSCRGRVDRIGNVQRVRLRFDFSFRIGRSVASGQSTVDGHGCIESLDRDRGDHASGHGPVPEGLEAVACNVQEPLAVRAVLAQRFEVILDAGQRVSQRIELCAAGDAAGRDEFALCVGADATDVARGRGEIEHPHHADDFIQQARDLLQFFRVPAGLDVGHERSARFAEIADRFTHDQTKALARTGAGHVARVGIGQSETRNLVFQRTVDKQQRASDIQERIFVCTDAAFDDVAHRIALGHDDLACHVEPHHPEGVADLGQRIHLRPQLGRIGAVGTQVQVKDILDPHQIFFDGASNRVKQGTIATGHTAARMRELGFRRGICIELEGLAQVHQRGMRCLRT